MEDFEDEHGFSGANRVRRARVWLYSGTHFSVMAPTSKVLVVTSDRRAGEGFRLGFEREGLPVSIATTVDGLVGLLKDVGVIVARAEHDDAHPAAGKALIEALVASLADKDGGHGEPPVLYVGNGVSRADALAAGARAVLKDPAYVRDVVTVARLLAGRRTENRSVMDGDLDAAFGVFYLIRALAAIGVTGTLMMVRGLRRGELRFFDGEVTSAQVGSLHGQSALHQLLLWTEARFELRDEIVVRRQQIPLSTTDMLEQAEHFLNDLRELAGPLSPAAIYGQDPSAIASAGTLPAEVIDVLRLFDGHRNLADALEDSPFRVLDTLRIASRAAEVGLLRRVAGARGRVTHRALLALEEWLVGSTDEIPRAVVPERSGPDTRGKRGKKKGGRASAPMPIGGGAGGGAATTAASVEVDWSTLTPRSQGLDSSLLSPVVPSSVAKGEITMRPIPTRTSREETREKLELLTDPDERDRLFLAKQEAEANATAAKAKADAEADARTRAAKAEADADARTRAAKAEADARAVNAKADAEEEAKAKAGNKARAEEEAGAKAAKAKAEADTKAKAEADTKGKATADHDAKAKERAEEEARARAKGGDRKGKGNDKRGPGKPGDGKPPATSKDGPSVLADRVDGARADAARLAAAATGAAGDLRPGKAESSPSSSSAIRIAAAGAHADDVRADAASVTKAATAAFSDEEEEFFKAGLRSADSNAPPAESFNDLDDGYEPSGFWDKFLNRKPTKPRR